MFSLLIAKLITKSRFIRSGKINKKEASIKLSASVDEGLHFSVIFRMESCDVGCFYTRLVKFGHLRLKGCGKPTSNED